MSAVKSPGAAGGGSSGGGRGGKLLAGVDLGSTSLKAVIYDLDGNVVASASRPTERFHPDHRAP